MSPPYSSETNCNTALASLLSRRLPDWNVAAQCTGVLENTRLQPDVFMEMPGLERWAVAVESKYDVRSGNLKTVERDAIKRLGVKVRDSRHRLQQTLVVLCPSFLQDSNQQASEHLTQVGLRYAMFSGESENDYKRFPKQGWVSGDVDELAAFIENTVFPQRDIIEIDDLFEQAVSEAASKLPSGEPSVVSSREAIGRALHQNPDDQTIRMGATVILNALLFQAQVSSNHKNIRSVAQLKSSTSGRLGHSSVIAEWQQIISINYWPIFGVALAVLNSIGNPQTAEEILRILGDACEQMPSAVASTANDLAGQVFGRLISDRKFLAAFYTRPEPAALLAELGVARLSVDWSDLSEVAELRISDFACGTGALLTASYRQAAQRAKSKGISDENLHKLMMERCLIGCDVLPAAVHITASTLASLQPEVPYDTTGIHVMPYGIQADGSVSIGSLELLTSQMRPSLFAEGPATITSSKIKTGSWLQAESDSMNIVIMNPPYTSSTDHQTDKHAGVSAASFASFNTTREEQTAMSKKLKAVTREIGPGSAGDGNAGLGSNFLDLGASKVKSGGVLALVLPSTFSGGDSWRKARELIAREFTDVTIVSIADSGTHDHAFSADTSIGEVLIIGTRKPRRENSRLLEHDNWQWVTIFNRPRSLPEAIETARAIRGTDQGKLFLGDTQLGTSYQAPYTSNLVHIKSLELQTIITAMLPGETWSHPLPKTTRQISIGLCKLAEIGSRGPVHRDINGKGRGPFEIEKLSARGEPAHYPLLWNHDHTSEKQMLVEHDSQGIVRENMNNQALKRWQSAARLHFPLEFSARSTRMAACATSVPCLGGRAFPSYLLHDNASETIVENMRWAALVLLWCNSTLGLLMRWAFGTRQQLGRSNTTIKPLPELLVADPRQLPETKLDIAVDVFNSFKNREFLPACQANKDVARQELDRTVLIELLDQPNEIMDWLDIIRSKWCQEPTVTGR